MYKHLLFGGIFLQSIKGTRINAGAIMLSAIIGLAATIVLLLITAALVQGGKLGEERVEASLVVINIIAGLICGITSRLSGRGGGSLNGLVGGAVYAAVLILVGFLLDMQTPQGAIIIKILAISIVCSFIGSKLNLAKSNKKLRKKRKS